MMRKITYILVLLYACALHLKAQDEIVQNRPYTDLRPFHFGILVGTHLQDIELLNGGPVTVTNDDGTTTESVITVDQDRWDPGFTVGVLGEFRLNTNFQFRIAPAMYFGTRHITFHNVTETSSTGKSVEQRQELKTAYISSAFDLIFASPRFNNHRPYIMAGLNPMINLSGGDGDYLKLKRYDLYAEVGLGCDFYLPYFKLRPELKFMYGLGNSLDTDHANKLSDKNMLPYTLAVKEAHTKMVVLTFYFE